MSPHEHDDVVQQNRAYWEHLAPHRKGEPVGFFQNGGSALTVHEIEEAGDLKGRRVLQLACSTGDEALSFAQLGAEVTAVDIAPSHLATGRDKAVRLGLSVDFIEQDMTDLDSRLTGFDLVYISWGGLCWAPDLTAWTKQVAQRLAPGGRLMISEHHPLWEVLSVRNDATLSISGDYFKAGRDGYDDPWKAPQVTRYLGQPALLHRSYVWNIGSVISAVLDAGLAVTSFQEFAEARMYPGLGERAQNVPATYVLTADRPRNEQR